MIIRLLLFVGFLIAASGASLAEDRCGPIYGGPCPLDGGWIHNSIGDFDGDGVDDILWRNQLNGDCTIWFMDGTDVRTSNPILDELKELPWMIVAADDFDGDGLADILWRDSSNGQTAISFMDGIAVQATELTSMQLDPSWQVQDAGDFDGDGKADILWRSTLNFSLKMWQMNGSTVDFSMPTSPSNLPSTWNVESVADFDEDGKADILVRRYDEVLYIWYMDGNERLRLGKPSQQWTLSDWQIVGVSNGSNFGKATIVWRHRENQGLFAWSMDANQFNGCRYIPTDSAQPLGEGTVTGQPNIILFNADNLGIGDFGCYGSTVNATPNIDQLAQQGMRFTDFCAVSPLCTSSRSALLTGCYPRRNNMHEFGWSGSVLRPVSPDGIHANEVTLAELLSAQGYFTACLGKWHLGDQNAFLPKQHGFDFYMGLLYSDEMDNTVPKFGWPPMPLMYGNQVSEAPTDVSDVTRRLTRNAQSQIRNHKQQPFFIYYPLIGPGSREEPTPGYKFIGTSSNGRYGDSVKEIDWAVGEIRKTLIAEGVEQNTIIIVTSDNGAPPPRGNPFHGSNAPLPDRSGWDASEAGFRVPLIVRFPEHTSPGSICNDLITNMDLFTTLSRFGDAPVPADRVIDGRDISMTLDGDSPRPIRETMYYYFGEQLQAVRWGKWKMNLALDAPLIQLGMGEEGVKVTGRSNRKSGPPRPLTLYDMGLDITETNDISLARPDLVLAINAIADYARIDLGDSNITGTGVRPSGWVDNPVPQTKK